MTVTAKGGFAGSDHYGDGGHSALFGLFLADGVCNGLCLWPSLCRSQSILVHNNPHHLLSLLLRFRALDLSLYLSAYFISHCASSACFLRLIHPF